MKTVSKIYTALIFLFLYAPIFILVFFSFNASNSTAVFSGFSLKWYRELFSDSNTLTSLYNTLILAFLSSIIATVIGTAAAIGIDKMKKIYLKKTMLSVTNIPMMNPEIVTGVSMMLLFVGVGRLLGISGTLSFWTILLAHITFNLPYVILAVLPKLRQTDPYLVQAAQDLGCKPIQAILKVVVPSIKPGILSGFIMALTMSIDDFIISYFVSGPGFQTLPIRIFSMTKKRVTPDMYALSTIIFAAILILLILLNISQKNEIQIKNKRR